MAAATTKTKLKKFSQGKYDVKLSPSDFSNTLKYHLEVLKEIDPSLTDIIDKYTKECDASLDYVDKWSTSASTDTYMLHRMKLFNMARHDVAMVRNLRLDVSVYLNAPKGKAA